MSFSTECNYWNFIDARAKHKGVKLEVVVAGDWSCLKHPSSGARVSRLVYSDSWKTRCNDCWRCQKARDRQWRKEQRAAREGV